VSAALAEQSVIGGCLINNEAYWKIAGRLVPDDFTKPFHRKAWEEIRDAAENGSPFDAVTLSEETSLPLVDLLVLANETPGSANIEAYARIIRERSTVRAASTIVAEAQSKLAAGDLDAIAELSIRLEGLHRADSTAIDFNTALQSGLEEIEQAQARANSSGGIVGAPTGISSLDDRLRGLEGGKLIILAARPSLGKTAMALQAAQSAAEAGFPVGFLSLEMGAGEIAVRAFAHQYQINNTALSLGDNEVVEQLTHRVANNTDKANRIKRLPIYIDEDTFDVGGMLGRIAEWHRKHQIKLVIIDHLQLVELPRDTNRNNGLGEVTRQLKLIAKRLDIPVMLLCQLSRGVEKEQRKPRLSDLRDSGNIEQDADIVIALNGGLDPNHNGMREVEVGFLKYRGGLVGWGGFQQFNGQTQTFRKGIIGYGYDENV